MTRDEFILSMRPTIYNLLRKYHHYGDEDLFQIAMLDVIAGYDRCIRDNILSETEQRKMCNTYAKYAILHELQKRNKEYEFFDVMDEDDIDEPTVQTAGDVEIKLSLENMLNDEEKQFVNLLYSGYNRFEIMSMLGISEKTFYNKKAKLFEKIKVLLQK